MQGAPEDGHTGRGYDKVGPCDYNPTKGLDVVKVQHGAKAASWSKSRSDRAKVAPELCAALRGLSGKALRLVLASHPVCVRGVGSC